MRSVFPLWVSLQFSGAVVLPALSGALEVFLLSLSAKVT